MSKKASDIFKVLYEKKYSIQCLGEKYKPPTKFVHSKEVLVATIRGEGDGQTVRIYESRLPARFFRIEVLAGKNSVGEPKSGFSFTTGSGEEMGELAGQMAKAIASGMLGQSGK